ncbi:MAG: pyridoxamine 5'-phosphate oxidase family protein [Anaerolineae bacterium]|nr:pyridoxamine 5'-phosphate oxidase family protein [Anaerolineae bacterium]
MMMSWHEFATAAPALAEFGEKRLSSGVAYLATIRADGSPRVHPVTPIIGEGRLMLYMEPTSPKGKDLQRDSRYQLHCAVENQEGGGGEFYVMGRARLITKNETDIWASVGRVGYQPKPHYILFELSVDGAFSTVYETEGPVRRRWNKE